MRILFAIDGSSGALEAISQLAPLLDPKRDEVAFYWAPSHETSSLSEPDADLVARVHKAFAEAIVRAARGRLHDALQNRAQMIIGTQDPRHGIIVAAEQWRADLIAVGARGLGLFKRLLLGSVSRAVVHESKIPVWVARPTVIDPDQGRRILLACEGPDTGKRPAVFLTRFAWPKGTTCRPLMVTSGFFAGKVPDWLQQQARSPDVEELAQRWVQEHEQDIQGKRARMAEFARVHLTAFADSPPMVAEGSPADEILAAIGRENAQLVVIGAKQKGTLAGIIFGSTAEAVLDHASCSVLVVPHQETP